MLLGHGESLLRSAYAVATGGEESSLPKGAGVLYLTNLRLVFETPVGGRIIGRRRGETATQLDVPLHDVRNVSVRRGRIGRPSLVLEIARTRPAFDVLEPESWAGTIAQAKRTNHPTAGTHVGWVHTVERQVVKVRCRYCGALGNEVDGRCPSCGAPL